MLYFLSLLLIDNFLSVDVGTEYFKIAKATYSGTPEIVQFPGVGESIPAAIAFKSSEPVNGPLTNETLEDVEVRYHKQAVSILKRNSSLGYQFIPRLIGRQNTTTFNTSNLVTPFEALCLTLSNALSTVKITDAVTFIVPHYWTQEQKLVLHQFCNVYKIPLKHVVDDCDVIGMQYSALRSKRFENATDLQSGYNVLFIDIGGTTTKVFELSFYMEKEMAAASESIYFWDENIGGYWFRKALSESLNISMKKAEKMLKRESDVEKVVKTMPKVVNRLYSMIASTTTYAHEMAEIRRVRQVDEVQIIGGASTYPFIMDLVKKATNITNVRHEFHPIETTAIAGVLASMQMSSESRYLPTFIYKRPPANITLKCGQENQLCRRGFRCDRYVGEHDSRACDVAYFLMDNASVPEGCSPILSMTKLVNISNMNFTDGISYYGTFEMSPTALEINNITWCKSSPVPDDASCYPIEFKNFYNLEDITEQVQLIKQIKVVHERREQKNSILLKIDALVSRLETFFNKISKGKVEVAVHVTDKQKEDFSEFADKFYKGDMKKLALPDLNQTYYDLKSLAKSLKMRFPEDEIQQEL